MLANGVPAPVVMKIGGCKKSSTMDIYLRPAGVDMKGQLIAWSSFPATFPLVEMSLISLMPNEARIKETII
ncbi:MAG: hypothetical protein A2X86_21545 [Bdellovibrionales bacterium GWA2_49_15]|nr:MAG: hypothetical protein A2X86_21545 [Bdellovibrionales bacterium GWA2_49_15]HAZ14965.1 hypothetical protein [Bdellovibrionales bacterium]